MGEAELRALEMSVAGEGLEGRTLGFYPMLVRFGLI